MTVLLIAIVIGVAFLATRRKPPIAKKETIEEVMDEVVKEPPPLPLKPIEDGYVLRPQPVWPIEAIGWQPGAIGYWWDEERDGWVGRLGLPFVPREARPDWERFIPVELTPLPPERLLYPQPVHPFETPLELHH